MPAMRSIVGGDRGGVRRYALLVLSLAAALFLLTADPVYCSTPPAAVSSPSFAVFGYLPEYRQHRFHYEAYFASGLTHLIFFSAEVNPVSLQLSHVDDRLPAPKEWRTIRALADHYGVKLMLCIGGGGRSEGFSKMVGDVLGRRRFIRDIRRVLQERELDGIDFNWEYPGSITEWLHFGQFLAELRSSLSQATAASTVGGGVSPLRRRPQPSPLLTMALHPHPSIPAVLRSSRVLPSLNYLHWMAYDNIVENDSHSSVAYAKSVLQDDVVGNLDDAIYNARLPQRHAIKKQQRGDGAVTRGPDEVDHRRKLCLGIPFYGRHREDRRVPPETYERLWQFISQWARKHHPKWVEGGPELRALSNYAGYDYTGYDDVKRKMRVARQAGIAGVMIWELGQDVPPGTSPMSLMTAVHEQLADWSRETTRQQVQEGTLPPLHASATLRGRPPAKNETKETVDDTEEDL